MLIDTVVIGAVLLDYLVIIALVIYAVIGNHGLLRIIAGVSAFVMVCIALGYIASLLGHLVAAIVALYHGK